MVSNAGNYFDPGDTLVESRELLVPHKLQRSMYFAALKEQRKKG